MNKSRVRGTDENSLYRAHRGRLELCTNPLHFGQGEIEMENIVAFVHGKWKGMPLNGPSIREKLGRDVLSCLLYCRRWEHLSSTYRVPLPCANSSYEEAQKTGPGRANQ